MKREYDFSTAKRAKDVPHLVRIQDAADSTKAPLSAKALLARDAKRDIGAELLQAVKEMVRGEDAVFFHTDRDT